MGGYDIPTSGTRDELYRALAQAVAVEHGSRRTPTITRFAAAVRYVEPALIPVAGGIWLYNLVALVTT